MPPKEPKKVTRTSVSEKSSLIGEFEDLSTNPYFVSLSVILEGETPGIGDWYFVTVFNGQVILDVKWTNGTTLVTDALPIDLKDPFCQYLATDLPLIFILRSTGGKGPKDPDPLLNVDNRAGATIDLLPLVIGTDSILTKVNLLAINTGQYIGCSAIVQANSSGFSGDTRTPLMITLISAHCLPVTREGTVYLGAICLNDIHDPRAINFGMSLSTPSATKIVWAAASNIGQAANTAYNVPSEDIFIPNDLDIQRTADCNSVYWNAMKRVLVDPVHLRERLLSTFLVEIAGVPRTGKVDVRGRYMAMIDAKVLLEPGQLGVTTCAKLLFFNEADLPQHVGALLDLPPTSAKICVRETDIVTDENGRNAYLIIRFDLFAPLIPRAKLASLFDIIGFAMPEGPITLMEELRADYIPEDSSIDVRRIRKEGGALAVHKELSNMACRGTVQMNQSIKRTAANRLLMRVRMMLKQFLPGECSSIDWQDVVTSQHSASRRAVTASFEPQLAPPRMTSRIAAARSRMAGDKRIANENINLNLKVNRGHPRALLSKVLRCLEEKHDTEARTYLMEALNAQSRNRYLLWMFGATEYDKGDDAYITSAAAFRIAVKGDISDGTSTAIGWAALHALHHYNKNSYAAFVTAKKMRKSYELPHEWKKFIQRWIDTSGEEETFWIPSVIDTQDPLLITAAFFLSLRCYSFSQRLLKCVEEGCTVRGSRLNLNLSDVVDIYYVKAASLLLQWEIDEALELTEEGIKKYGPSGMMSQMRVTCLMYARGWDGGCESALQEADKAGAELCPALLLRSALGGLKTNPEVSLQRAARAHKIAPSAHSALLIGRIYAKMENEYLAERWVVGAVKLEPLLADAWAMLALLAMRQLELDKARAMLRTAKQVGVLTPDIEEEITKIMKVLRMETLPDVMAKDICFCDYS